ncbi:MAG TPA: helix-turn-helix domain-containing protein [Planctomycetota bacterium]|nr:helix-turn-helix domain-containing protein [Planctomycetota bacterium]
MPAVTIEQTDLRGLLLDVVRQAIREEFGPPAEKGGGEPSLLLTVRQVAAALGVGARSVWRMASAGELPGQIKVGGATRWQRAAIEDFVAERAKRAALRRRSAKTLDARGLPA